MTTETIRAARQAHLFRPFTISLADGRRYFVAHSECLAIPPGTGRTVLVTSLDFSKDKEWSNGS